MSLEDLSPNARAINRLRSYYFDSVKLAEKTYGKEGAANMIKDLEKAFENLAWEVNPETLAININHKETSTFLTYKTLKQKIVNREKIGEGTDIEGIKRAEEIFRSIHLHSLFPQLGLPAFESKEKSARYVRGILLIATEIDFEISTGRTRLDKDGIEKIENALTFKDMLLNQETLDKYGVEQFGDLNNAFRILETGKDIFITKAAEKKVENKITGADLGTFTPPTAKAAQPGDNIIKNSGLNPTPK